MAQLATLLLALTTVALSPVYAAPAIVERAAPTVTLDGATFTGTTTVNVQKFLGIPFAKPPVGDLRFRLPVPITYTNGTYSATAYGPSCPQQAVTLPLLTGAAAAAVDVLTETIFEVVFPDAEDCLTVNVVKPASIASGKKLPVVVWIFGGAFELGGTSMYDGGIIVEKSIAMGQPVVYVSMNYRLSLFGFLASQEVKDAGVGNLGLQDQRQALRWVQKYISNFGGDPNHVTIWGESAGAISVSLQMLANGGNTEGLFHAGFMQSGSPIPVGDITHGQQSYDAAVKQVGCSGAADTLACLRTVPYSALHAAMDNSPSIFAYQSLALTWLPRTDGVFLKDTPQNLVAQGSVANIPIVTGDCDDEGTLFSLANLNVTTEAQLHKYMKDIYVPTGTDAEIDNLLAAYPADITQGSPFNTGIFNAVTPQFKRLAAMQGDVVFQAPRRYFINKLAGKQNIWVYLHTRLKATPVLGSFHGSDILTIYADSDMTAYLLRFANSFSPNGGGALNWPNWDPSGRKLLTFQGGLFPLALGTDTYRDSAINSMINLTLAHPI
ncbi:hypothetical protein M422DRAFT_226451 [Sphaerobolus stellatus SS14]|nr:hypothetical protein M422DRAFT_226451 [Sphaerobolus stellatus SS14]